MPKPHGSIRAGALQVRDPPDHRKRGPRASAACQICRARKTKCDAQRPECSACTNRGTKCEYDIEPNTTRHTSLKRKHQNLEEEHSELIELFDMLKLRSESDAQSILNRIRSGSDLRSTINFIKEGDLLMQARATSTESYMNVLPRAASRLEAYLNLHHARAYPPLPPLNDSPAELGQERKSILNMGPQEVLKMTGDTLEDLSFVRKPRKYPDERLGRIEARRWTTVTFDDAVVANLVSLYLAWEHSSFRIFDEDYFLDQMAEEKTDYCSSLLVNIICAVGGLNYVAIDPEAEMLATRFFEEAKRLWRAEEGETELLHIPASILMNIWCNSNCKDKIGTWFLSQGIRVAKDLGLFRRVQYEHQQREGTPPEVQKGRAIIAWGIFNWQAIHSLITQIEPEFPRPPVIPISSDASIPDDKYVWDSFPLLRPKQMNCRELVMKALSELCIILNEYMLRRESVENTDQKESGFENAKVMHFKLLQWADTLDQQIVRGPHCLPSVLDLHLFYHAFIVAVFRPFASEGSDRESLARDLVEASLAQLQRVLYIQRFRYGGPPLTSNIALTIHILMFVLLEKWSKSPAPDQQIEFYLLLCANAMREIGECFHITLLILHGLLAQAKKRNRGLPVSLQNIFDDIKDQLPRKIAVEEVQSRYPIDLELAITDPEKTAIETLLKATYAPRSNSA